MLRSFGFAILLCAVGTVAAALWTFVLGVAGAPGGRVTLAGTRRGSTLLVALGALLTFLAQTYLALAWAGCLALSLAHFLGASGSARHWSPAWPLWLAGWYLATAPALLLARDGAKAPAHHVRPRLAGVTFLLTVAGYWVFARWPGLLAAGWPWVPPLPL